MVVTDVTDFLRCWVMHVCGIHHGFGRIGRVIGLLLLLLLTRKIAAVGVVAGAVVGVVVVVVEAVVVVVVMKEVVVVVVGYLLLVLLLMGFFYNPHMGRDDYLPIRPVSGGSCGELIVDHRTLGC